MKIIIMRGIPGSGKSTYLEANYEKSFVVSADHYFSKTSGKYIFVPTDIQSAHAECMRHYIRKLADIRDGITTIDVLTVDNTNIHTWEFSPYILVAQSFGHENIEIVTIKCDAMLAAHRNTHGVPERVVQKMANELKSEWIPPWIKHTIISAKEAT